MALNYFQKLNVYRSTVIIKYIFVVFFGGAEGLFVFLNVTIGFCLSQSFILLIVFGFVSRVQPPSPVCGCEPRLSALGAQ